MLVWAYITQAATGQTVEVPLWSRQAVSLIKKWPPWRYFFFHRGLGLPIDGISRDRAHETREGAYRVRLTAKHGKVIYEEKADAGQVSGPAQVGVRGERGQVGQGPSLRHQGQAAGQGEEDPQGRQEGKVMKKAKGKKCKKCGKPKGECRCKAW